MSLILINLSKQTPNSRTYFLNLSFVLHIFSIDIIDDFVCLREINVHVGIVSQKINKNFKTSKIYWRGIESSLSCVSMKNHLIFPLARL